MDRLSNLPAPIIEAILCLIPIEEAGRTSVLSKEWRYKWTRIPKIVIQEHTFYDDDPNSKKHRLYDDISHILTNHQGPLREFTLSIIGGTLDEYKVPLSLLPMHQLKDLYLSRCNLDGQLIFKGSSSLTSLYLHNVCTSTETLLHVLSSCPLLKSLNLDVIHSHIQGIKKLPIMKLFGYLQVIENLTISLYVIQSLAHDGAPHKLPTALVNLKYLCLKQASFVDKYDNFRFLAFMMRSCPNLQKLCISIVTFVGGHNPERGSFTVEAYSDLLFEHLNELEITNLSNKKRELDFVKLVLAKSPKLKKVKILPLISVDEDVELQISRTLLSSPRASPGAEIIVGVE